MGTCRPCVDPVLGQMEVEVFTTPPGSPAESCKTSMSSQETQSSSLRPTRRTFIFSSKSPYLYTGIVGFATSSSWTSAIVVIEPKVRSSLDAGASSRSGPSAICAKERIRPRVFFLRLGWPRAVSRQLGLLLRYAQVGRRYANGVARESKRFL